jgi:hypothetical protein
MSDNATAKANELRHGRLHAPPIISRILLLCRSKTPLAIVMEAAPLAVMIERVALMLAGRTNVLQTAGLGHQKAAEKPHFGLLVFWISAL